jgi:hypothetical protein
VFVFDHASLVLHDDLLPPTGSLLYKTRCRTVDTAPGGGRRFYR